MKAFDITAFYHGLQMQLPVYLNAALASRKRNTRTRRSCRRGSSTTGSRILLWTGRIPGGSGEQYLKELKLDGLVNAEEDVVEHLEHGLSGSSVLFPIGRNKDGSLSQRSKALAPEEFDTVLHIRNRRRRI